jgi:hypothetical protein
MWRTPSGDRKLGGSEWLLFREGLRSIRKDTERRLKRPKKSRPTGDPFEDLQPASMLATLAIVGGALSSDEPAPEHTAVAEATVAAVFGQIRVMILYEIEEAERLGRAGRRPTRWRSLVIEAERECFPDSDLDDNADADDPEKWAERVESLSDMILWDADHAAGSMFLDLGPEDRKLFMEMSQIEERYYIAIAPDPTDAQLIEVRQALDELAAICSPSV